MASIFGVLKQAGSNVAALKATLEQSKATLLEFKANYPDLGEQVDAQVSELDTAIAALDAPVAPDALLALSLVCLHEIKDIGTGHLNPTPHAGSGI